MKPADFTVGWVSALPIELAAAQEMLDEQYEDLPQASDDSNIYTCGRIGQHNVVLACLPAGLTGTNSAAGVVMQLKSTFYAIRFGLLVGIGGGVPSEENDIRLGDIVVSQPNKSHGGVIQYDFGKSTPTGFERTGCLNTPPRILLGAVAKLQASHDRGKSNLLSHISKINSKVPKFARDQADGDILFKGNYNHVGGNSCKSCDKSQCVQREESKHMPSIHYGTIASGNQVMRYGVKRDQTSLELGGVLCFEMEAAGLMNNFPCLVIRGMCDYADSHKNKKWQPYAAGTAAAYAKELLLSIPPADVTKTRTAEEATAERLQGIHSNLQQQSFAKSEKEAKECKQYLFLTNPRLDKRHIEEKKGVPMEEVYHWILKNLDFQHWRENQQSGLLWIKGDPGKGKTMLICGIINELKKSNTTSLLSYFFCQATDARLNNATAVLRGLIYLLVDQQPSLILHVQRKYDDIGKRIFEDTNAWYTLDEIFTDILQDPILQDRSFNTTYLIIDALDECGADKDRDLLLDFIAQKSTLYPCVKWIVSNRNWPQIGARLEEASDLIRLSLELNEECVARAVKTYIQLKVEKLAKQQCYDYNTQTHVETYLSLYANNTFLWVALVCDNLKKIPRKVPRARVLIKLEEYPSGLPSLYKRMLEQIDEGVIELCRRILALIAIVYRRITLKELISLENEFEDMFDN
ncbi:MAG: hypothetical protein M1821_005042 [Bathelium mastoideum]|nr:MAG: hypothetical protein M1821_005042 [Bathelium mastoideum]